MYIIFYRFELDTANVLSSYYTIQPIVVIGNLSSLILNLISFEKFFWPTVYIYICIIKDIYFLIKCPCILLDYLKV